MPAALQIVQAREVSARGMSKRARGSRTSRTTIRTVPATTSTVTTDSARVTGLVKPDDSCKTQITPACLQAIYNIPSDAALNSSSNIFVASFVGESTDPADLKVRILIHLSEGFGSVLTAMDIRNFWVNFVRI